MKLWPFGGGKREARESGGGYEASLLAQFESNAAGGSSAKVGAIAALEAASGLVARCLASARVEGPANLAAACTPAVLAQTGRSLIRSGESVHAIHVDVTGRVRLGVAGHHDVYGPADPSEWTYRVSEYGPSGTGHRLLPAAGVVHVRYLTDPIRPWAGVGPLQAAQIAGRLSAEVGNALADGESGPRGNLLPLPIDPEPDPDDPDADPLAGLKADLRNLRGRLAFVESTQTMHAGAPGSAPRSDWETKRIGANPPAGEVSLLERSFLEVLSACGVPPGLFATGADAGQRESFRRFLHATLDPLSKLIAAELSDKLEAPLTLNLDGLFAADLAGRARAFQSMTGAGMPLERAAALSGLMGAEE